MDKLTLSGAGSAVLLISLFTFILPQADSYLAIPPTRAISNITSETGVNVSAVFSQDNIFFTGLVEFFPLNKTIKVLGDGQANLTELAELLNQTVLVPGDQININPINATHSFILLEPCLDDQFLVYVNASSAWICTDLSTINGTGPGGNQTHINLTGDAFVFKNETGNSVFFRGLTAGSNIILTERDGDILINSTGTGAGGNVTGAAGLNITNAFFTASEATIDDLTGTDCVNEITLNFFDNTEPNQYRREAVSFCSNSDTDDNLSWLYVVPPGYNQSDLEFNLFWTDDNGDGGSVIRQISASEDDAEEASPNNPTDPFRVSIGSSDLELHNETLTDPDRHDLTGMRFLNITIPQAATISNATIQFEVDESNSADPLNVVFDGHDIDNSPEFINCGSCGNISGRVGTTASVNWSIPEWGTVGERGPDQVTPSLASIVQEIINRPGWVSGNALTIMIRDWIDPDPAGERHAESFDGGAEAPEITIAFQTDPGGETKVCFEISFLPLEADEFLDSSFVARKTICIDRAGIDQLSITPFTILEADHGFEAGDLVFIRIHRPNDFVSGDFESDVFVLGGELKYIN